MKHFDVKVNQEKQIQPIKALNGVNNGPLSIYDGQKFLFDASSFFQEAEIHRVRLHDVEYPYGSELFVDYECIFPIFDLDANDPANYHFEETDRYLAGISGSGAKILYRLGVSIEGSRVKRFIGPPRDFQKFAVICEHIVAHYTQGWKRGYFYKDILWEIWNEPNGMNDMWTCGNEAYAEMYAVVAKHLKSKFPNELVGGPTVSYMTGVLWPNCPLLLEAFRKKLKSDPTIPLDFFSFHNYSTDPEDVVANTYLAKELCEDTGHPNAMLVMDEYNMTDWAPNSQEFMVTQKAAAFLAAQFVTMQNSPLTEASYYSAQIWPVFKKINGILTKVPGEYRTGWNGLFHLVDDHLETMPPFEAFIAFRDLRRLGTQIETEVIGDGKVYAMAATNGKNYGAYIVNFTEEDVEVTFRDETFTLEAYKFVSKKW